MSWAAHEFENYFIQHHVGVKASFLGIVVGALAPDLFTKALVYAADDPAGFHRGWPGVGFTHSLTFGFVFALVVLAVTRSRGWALGILIGQWAHVLTDISDTAGVMPFFPFSTELFTISMWKHAAAEGRNGDAAAYYSSLGGVWDAFWLVMPLTFASRSLRRDWGGPRYVAGNDLSDAGVLEMVIRTGIGGVLFVAFLWLCWATFVRRLWQRGFDVPAVGDRGRGLRAVFGG